MDGIIPLWKERGMTSHDCVFKLRKILQTKKVGHGGTLDPDVDGVLPICVGKGTKVIEYLQDSGKTYIGEITLGYSTTTEDKSGEIVGKSIIPKDAVTETLVDQAMAEMVGSITQIPPMYSAVKVDGKRLYEYARAGLEVERPERIAKIDTFERTSPLTANEEEGTVSWRFSVQCGKGTYVRTLAVDTGKKLGFEAHMSDLTRTGSGGFVSSECFTLEQIADKMSQEDLSFLQPIEKGVEGLSRVTISEEEYQIVKNGGFFESTKFKLAHEEELFAIFYQGLVVSIYQQHPRKPEFMKPVKVLRNN